MENKMTLYKILQGHKAVMEVSSVTVTTSYTVQAKTSMISSYCTVPFSPMFLKYKVVFILGIFCGLLQTIT